MELARLSRAVAEAGSEIAILLDEQLIEVAKLQAGRRKTDVQIYVFAAHEAFVVAAGLDERGARKNDLIVVDEGCKVKTQPVGLRADMRVAQIFLPVVSRILPSDGTKVGRILGPVPAKLRIKRFDKSWAQAVIGIVKVHPWRGRGSKKTIPTVRWPAIDAGSDDLAAKFFGNVRGSVGAAVIVTDDLGKRAGLLAGVVQQPGKEMLGIIARDEQSDHGCNERSCWRFSCPTALARASLEGN